jgi:ATP-dependent metalloprotease
MPRGHALGITFTLPEMDRVSQTKSQMLAWIDVCMGGKVGERILNGEEAVTSGAASDISAATSTAFQMVASCGMSERLGDVDYAKSYNSLPTETKHLIWDEVRVIIEESRKRAEKILHERRKELDLLAQGLMDYETLNKEEIEKVVKGEKLEGKMKAGEGPIKMPELKGPSGGVGIPAPSPFPRPPDEPSGTPGGGGGLGVPSPIPGPPAPQFKAVQAGCCDRH